MGGLQKGILCGVLQKNQRDADRSYGSPFACEEQALEKKAE
jgi:hypothetical protein